MDRVDYESLVIQDLINLQDAEELDIDPWYQRRAVWSTPQKAYLINSIFENKPIPTIYIRHYLDLEKEKSIKEIVDGQQRVRSVLEYAAGEYAARHPEHEKPVRYPELRPGERAQFKMTKLAVGYLINADDEDVIEIFGRLNSVSKVLNAQEKRNAAYSGEMKQFCLKEAAKRIRLWRELQIFSSTDLARMLEVQFVSDVVLNFIDGLSDFSSKKLDQLYSKNDDSFPKRVSIRKRLDAVFSLIASLDPKVIKDTIFSRQPLFFSLVLILDSAKRLSVKRLEERLLAIDREFHSDIPVAERSAEVAEFIAACTSSTQRIRARRVRDRYIRKALGIK